MYSAKLICSSGFTERTARACPEFNSPEISICLILSGSFNKRREFVIVALSFPTISDIWL